MKISDIVSFLESLANPALQEHYDNAGLIIGQADWNCTGIICSLDATEDVVQEAIDRKCNMIVAHHPIIFSGLKKINGKNYVEKTIIAAIKNDIAIYAIHTNLDNVISGVTGKMAAMLGLQNISVLSPKENTLKKLYTFVPIEKADHVRNVLFTAGAGHIGNYSETSFNTDGTGTFKAGEGANPFVGDIGKLHQEKETKIEVLFPGYLEKQIIAALLASHPYEEVAYDIINLSNTNQKEGSGILGELPVTMDEMAFLTQLKQIFKLKIIRHSPLLNRPIKKVALCSGAGSFLVSKALASGADIFVTADMKYHEFFDANSRMIIADIGHYESEQFTIELLGEFLEKKFPTFAVLKTKVETNPVKYF
jgi:dinuclear metal center YbgI/SA1388 family protein